MKPKPGGDALFYNFIFKVVRLVTIGIVIVIYMSYVFAEVNPPPPTPPHVCEVTSADLKHIIKVMDDKIAYRDMQIAGLQKRASRREGMKE